MSVDNENDQRKRKRIDQPVLGLSMGLRDPSPYRVVFSPSPSDVSVGQPEQRPLPDSSNHQETQTIGKESHTLSTQTPPFVLPVDMTALFNQFRDYLKETEKTSEMLLELPNETSTFPLPSTEADRKLAALKVTFTEEQKVLFRGWIEAKQGGTSNGELAPPSSSAQSTQQQQGTNAAATVTDPSTAGTNRELFLNEPARTTHDVRKHLDFWMGRTDSTKCPKCDDSVTKYVISRVEHYIRWHYDIYFEWSPKESDIEKWLGCRIGRRRRKGLGDLRVCLICEFGALYDGRDGLLSHIEEVHPDQFADMQKEYKEWWSTAFVEDEMVHQMLMGASREDRPTTSTRNERIDNGPSTSSTNTESVRAREVRKKLQSKYADCGLGFEEIKWLKDEDAMEFRAWMQYWESEEGREKGGPPRNLFLICTRRETRDSDCNQGIDAPLHAKETLMARKVRERVNRRYADCGLNLEGVWFKDEDAVKFDEWMEFWESQEGKAAGGPPKPQG